MRLLFVFDIGFDRGGPSVHLLQDVLRAALIQGHKVHVILKDTNGPDDCMPEEFRFNPLLSYELIEWAVDDNGDFHKRYINEIKYANLCGKTALKAGRFDSVFLQSTTITFFYMRYLRKLKCRIIYNIQDIFPYNLKLSGQLPMERITFPFFRMLQNMGYKMADAIITISDDMKQTLIDDGIDAEKIEVIYNWSYADTPISLEAIDPQNIYDLHLDHNKFNVIYAGNIGKMQNVELIAKTAYIMREDQSVHFFIIGNGSNEGVVKHMVKDIKNITVLPMQSSKYAESIYAQADLNVIPLKPGGIMTALPSKTATVLRVDRPVVFCIDKSNSLLNILEPASGVYFSDVDNEAGLQKVIYDLRKRCQNTRFLRKEIIYKYFSRNNARRYVDVLKGEYND